jgi:predicted small metal-binding protein
MTRKVADCRDYPNEVGCTLTLSGEEEEVMRAAVEHATTVHGEEDSPALRETIRQMLKDEGQPAQEEASPAPA